MLIRYLFLFLALLTACSPSENSKKMSAEDRFDAERDKIVHRALKKFILSMEAKGYRAAGIGEGLDHSTEKQNYLEVTFDIEELPNVEFARKVEVEAIQEFLRFINSEEGIQDYVAEYPYPINFVHIALISRHPEKGLFSVANYEEKISYYQDMPGKPMERSIKIHSESYKNAVRILKGSATQFIELDPFFTDATMTQKAPLLQACDGNIDHLREALETYPKNKRNLIIVAVFVPFDYFSPKLCMQTKHYISPSDSMICFNFNKQTCKDSNSCISKTSDCEKSHRGILNPLYRPYVKQAIHDYQALLEKYAR